MNYINATVELTLLSDLLCATGESTAFIDATPVIDKYGFPYIKGKTFRGLLKEAAIEVEEITGEYSKQADCLFGTDMPKSQNDTAEGWIKIPNVKIKHYVAVKEAFNKTSLCKQDVINYLTYNRKQTKIDDDGVAEDKSLRTYKLIKKDFVTFQATITFPEEYKSLIHKAFLQLRYIGLRRNRGFGKISITEFEMESVSVNTEKITLKSNELTPDYKLNYRLIPTSPLHISKPVGDQNTEGTEDYIPGMAMRGIIAKHLIRQNELGKNAHEDALFRALILENINYHNACLIINEKVATPMPLALVYNKILGEEKRVPLNVFTNNIPGAKNFKKWTIDISKPNSNKEVELTQSFHTKRSKNRLAGKSMEKDGAIYYYESIEEEQAFGGSITGPKEYLELVKDIMQKEGHAVGGSKATQYGNVSFACDDIVEDLQVLANYNAGDEFYLVLQSHAILYNENGYPEPTLKELQRHLNEIGLGLSGYQVKTEKDELCQAAARVTRVEGFYSLWHSKTDMDYAYAMGSTFKVIIISNEVYKSGDAIGERTNEGFGRFVLYDELEFGVRKIDEERENTLTGTPPAIKVETDTALPGPQSEIKLVIDIQKHSENLLDSLQLKSYAFDEAKKLAGIEGLKNHQISVLKRELKTVSFEIGSENEEYHNWVSRFKKDEKSKTNLLFNEGLIKFKTNGSMTTEGFNKYKEAWLMVFDYLRVKKKRNVRSNN